MARGETPRRAMARSPGDRLAVAEEAAAWAVGEGGGREDGGDALRQRAVGVAAAHVGADPAGADGVDADAARGELGGEQAYQRVQAYFGHVVCGRRPACLLVAVEL